MVQIIILLVALSIVGSIGKMLMWGFKNIIKAALVVMFIMLIIGKL